MRTWALAEPVLTPRLDQASTTTWFVVAALRESSADWASGGTLIGISSCFVESVAKSFPERKPVGIAASGHT